MSGGDRFRESGLGFGFFFRVGRTFFLTCTETQQTQTSFPLQKSWAFDDKEGFSPSASSRPFDASKQRETNKCFCLQSSL